MLVLHVFPNRIKEKHKICKYSHISLSQENVENVDFPERALLTLLAYQRTEKLKKSSKWLYVRSTAFNRQFKSRNQWIPSTNMIT